MKKHGYLVFAAAAGVALFAAQAPALAQGMPMPGIQLGGQKEISPEEKAKMEANEQAAKAAQSSIPTPKASNDPWASVRSGDDEPSKPKKTKSVH